MLNTVSKTFQPPTENKRKPRAKKKFNLVGLPNEILLTVFDNLDVFDSATLALTCKRFAGLASSYSQLDLPTNTTRGHAVFLPYGQRHFLKKRLGDKYFSERLRYCWGCKHYVPRRKGHWKRKLGKKGQEGAYRAFSRVTFEEWWVSPKTQQMLIQWNKGQAFKCPRCKICRA